MAGHEPAAPRIDVGEPISDTLLGQITQWKPTGCIAFKHRNGVISELMRIQFPMTFEDEIVAKWFGLETARILLDSSDRLFAIARYEREKRLAKQSRRGAQQR
jgi:hypothetical protein